MMKFLSITNHLEELRLTASKFLRLTPRNSLSKMSKYRKLMAIIPPHNGALLADPT